MGNNWCKKTGNKLMNEQQNIKFKSQLCKFQKVGRVQYFELRLPEKWEVVKLNKLFEEVNKKDRSVNLKPYEKYKTVLTKLYAKGIQLKEIKQGNKISAKVMYKIREGDFIFSKINLRKGSFDFVPLQLDGAVVSTEHPILKLNRILADELYVKYFLSQPFVWETLKQEAKGFAGKDRIKTKEFLSYTIPLPPLPEQQKIAAVLSAVQEAKEKTEAVIAAAKALKKSMMKHLFTYGPVSPQEAESVLLKETEIGPVPEDWEVVKLGEVAESFIGGGTPPTDIKEYWNGTVHWTTSKKINDLYLLNGEKKITEKGLRESSTHLIPKDNLIIGTRVGVGKVAINKIDIAISQDLTGVFIDNKKYSLEYLAYQISTVQIQKYLKECMRGTTIKGIPRDDLKRLPLQIPPLPIQQKIASILSAIDAKIEAEENKKKALEELFKSLLHNLMTANIRVNQLEITV